MAKQQHQNPKQGTSSTSKRSDEAQPGHEPSDDGMDTRHRAGHVSSTDDRFGGHASLGSEEFTASPGASGKDRAGERASASRTTEASKQPTRGGAQSGLTGSVDQLTPGRPVRADAAHDTSSRRRPGEARGDSKYSPTADEQDELSRALGGAPLKDDAPPGDEDHRGAKSARATSTPQAPSGATSSQPPKRRDPRDGGHGAAGDDSPSVRSPADRGSMLTATHDIDLAGPNRSGTKRDR